MIAPIDVSDIRIETSRLILRPWQMSDLDDLYEYARVDGVGQMAGWLPHTSRDESMRILNLFIEERKTFALELKENGKTIGSLGLERAGAGDIPGDLYGREIGYVLSKEYWGRGLMPEAVQAVIDFCFRQLNWDFLLCAHFKRNHQSRRVIEKCGFSYLNDVLHKTRYETVEDTMLYIRYNER